MSIKMIPLKITSNTNDICINTKFDLILNNVKIVSNTGNGRFIKLHVGAKNVWNSVVACGFSSDLHTSTNPIDNSLYCDNCIMRPKKGMIHSVTGSKRS